MKKDKNSNYFLNYTGAYKKLEDGQFEFIFKEGKKIMPPTFIFPPVYDNPYKILFSYDESGSELIQDCLNKIIYPESQSIIEVLSFANKEIPGVSDILFGKGAKRVDNAFFVKIKDGEDTKNILIDVEMVKKFNHSLTEKYYDYANALRMANNFPETWVISFCIDDSKRPFSDKGSNTDITKKYNVGEPETLNYVKIYEIYLNNLFKNIEGNISVFKNEIIKSEGKEWIKLLTITLWSENYGSNEAYPIPSELSFVGEKIGKAIDKINIINIDNTIRVKISGDIRQENKIKEENEKKLKNQYNEGYQNGEENGYQMGEAAGYIMGEEAGYHMGEEAGYERGQAEGYQKGANETYQNSILTLKLSFLDQFYNNYTKGKSLENIEIIGKIDSQLLNDRFGALPFGTNFIGELYSRNLVN